MANRSEHVLGPLPRPGGQIGDRLGVRVDLMHQVGHSRAQIMHDVQAGSISRIEP